MAASFIRAAEDELACPICFELFTDPNTPKTLACGHVCCEVCLKDMAAGKCLNKECPECRKPVIFTKDGTTSLPTNFRLRNLAEKHQKVGDGQDINGTSTSEPDQDQSKADSKEVKSTKPVGDRACPVHEDEPQDFYCTTCNKLACRTCVTETHIGPGHRCERANDKYADQIRDIQAMNAKVSLNIEKAKNKKQELITIQHQLRENTTTTEERIDHAVESHINTLLEQSNLLKIQAQTKLTDIDQTMAQLAEEIKTAQTTHQAALQLLQHEPDYKNITQLTPLVDQMNNLGLEDCVSRINATPFTATRFVPASAVLLGRVVSVMPGKARKLELIQTLDGVEYAINTASSQDGSLLAVCDSDAMKVIIYRKVSNGQYEKSSILNLTSSNQSKPLDVTFCSSGILLVARQTCVEVYTPEGNYLQGISITENTGTRVNVSCVTTKSNGRILVGDTAQSVITEHDSTTGDIVSTIKTNIKLWDMTLIHDTHIAMCDSPSGKVSVMDMQSEEETLSIDIPMVEGICYDEQTECLLTVRSDPVSDDPERVTLNTGVIEQYCYTTGRLVASLAKGLYHPVGIRFLSDGKVAVANEESVKIYNIE